MAHHGYSKGDNIFLVHRVTDFGAFSDGGDGMSCDIYIAQCVVRGAGPSQVAMDFCKLIYSTCERVKAIEHNQLRGGIPWQSEDGRRSGIAGDYRLCANLTEANSVAAHFLELESELRRRLADTEYEARLEQSDWLRTEARKLRPGI